MTFFPDQKGFTLIELIVVIVILGILGAAGALGLKQAMDGYNLAKANSTSTQKAQNALDRITIELSHIIYIPSVRYNISAGTGNSITYTANFGGTDETSTIQLSGTQVLLKNNPLTDGVTGLVFNYYKGDGTLDGGGATDASMRLIEVTLKVQVTPIVTRLYTARVALQQ